MVRKSNKKNIVEAPIEEIEEPIEEEIKNDIEEPKEQEENTPEHEEIPKVKSIKKRSEKQIAQFERMREIAKQKKAELKTKREKELDELNKYKLEKEQAKKKEIEDIHFKAKKYDELIKQQVDLGKLATTEILKQKIQNERQNNFINLLSQQYY